MTINITCTSGHIWKNVYSKFKHNGRFKHSSKFKHNCVPCFHNKHYWEKLDSGSYELTKTIRVGYDGLYIAEDYCCNTLGMYTGDNVWQGMRITVSEEDTYNKLIDDIAKYVLHLTDNYLN